MSCNLTDWRLIAKLDFKMKKKNNNKKLTDKIILMLSFRLNNEGR